MSHERPLLCEPPTPTLAGAVSHGGGALVGEAFLVPSIPSFMPMCISLLLTYWDAEVGFGGRWHHPWANPPEAQALSFTLPTPSTLSLVS